MSAFGKGDVGQTERAAKRLPLYLSVVSNYVSLRAGCL